MEKLHELKQGNAWPAHGSKSCYSFDLTNCDFGEEEHFWWVCVGGGGGVVTLILKSYQFKLNIWSTSHKPGSHPPYWCTRTWHKRNYEPIVSFQMKYLFYEEESWPVNYKRTYTLVHHGAKLKGNCIFIFSTYISFRMTSLHLMVLVNDLSDNTICLSYHNHTNTLWFTTK